MCACTDPDSWVHTVYEDAHATHDGRVVIDDQSRVFEDGELVAQLSLPRADSGAFAHWFCVGARTR